MRMLASELPKAVFCAWAAVLLSHCGASEGPTATGTGLKTESSGTAATTATPEPREPCEKPATEACETLCNTEGTRQLDTTTCSYGDCVPLSIEAETCNGKDDDCDGQTDEDFECAAGSTKECETSCGTVGTVNCSQSCQWEAECIPPREICDNGVDDDCNGITDEFGILSERKASITGEYKNSVAHDYYWSNDEYSIVWAPTDKKHMSIILFSRFPDIRKKKYTVLSTMPRQFQGRPQIEKNGDNFLVAWVFRSVHPEYKTYIYYLIISREGQIIVPERILYEEKGGASLRWIANYRDEYWIGVYKDSEMRSMIYVVSPEGDVRHTRIIESKTIIADGRDSVYLGNEYLSMLEKFFPSPEPEHCINFPEYQLSRYNLESGSQLMIANEKTRLTNSPLYVRDASVSYNGKDFLVAYTDGRGKVTRCDQVNNYRDTLYKLFYREDQYDDIYLVKTDENLTKISEEHPMNGSGGYADSPHLIWNATHREYAIAWRDGRDSAIGKKPCKSDLCFREVYDAREVYFTRLDSSGKRTMKDCRVSRTKLSVSEPHITWTGTEYSVLWYDQNRGFLRDTRLGCK